MKNWRRAPDRDFPRGLIGGATSGRLRHVPAGRAGGGLLRGFLSALGPTGSHPRGHRLLLFCVIGRRFLVGVASDAVSATGVAATAGRREEDRPSRGLRRSGGPEHLVDVVQCLDRAPAGARSLTTSTKPAPKTSGGRCAACSCTMRSSSRRAASRRPAESASDSERRPAT